MSKEIALFLTGAIVPLGIWLCVLHYRFLGILRTSHHDRWSSIGSPKLAFSKTIGAEISVTRFLFSGEYRSLEDPVLTHVGDDLRVAHVLFLGAIVGSTLLFALQVLN